MRNRVTNLWTFGGLSLPDLLRRTATASWNDDVFGQGGRMAFYQFLALFPSLLIAFALIGHTPHLAQHLRTSLGDLSSHLLPDQISQIIQAIIADAKQRPRSGLRLLSVFAAMVWAAHNGTWAMIWGLNRAYEAQEHRPLWKLTLTIILLTISLGLTAVLAVLLLFSSAFLEEHVHAGFFLLRALEYLTIAVCLYFCFAVLYVFGPDIPTRSLRRSTPGALCALILWLIFTIGAQIYFNHINDYTRSYGPLNRVVILLLWLYLSNGALLIGGEMNSTIQKAEDDRKSRGSHPPAARHPARRAQ